jgi:hypothetical protein
MIPLKFTARYTRLSIKFVSDLRQVCNFDKKRSKPDSIDCTPPEFIMPNSKERPLLPLHPNIKELKVRSIIKLEHNDDSGSLCLNLDNQEYYRFRDLHLSKP